MKWLLIVSGLLAAALCQGCCRPGGLFGQQGYGYYGSYPVAPAASYPAYSANPCTCQ